MMYGITTRIDGRTMTWFGPWAPPDLGRGDAAVAKAWWRRREECRSPEVAWAGARVVPSRRACLVRGPLPGRADRAAGRGVAGDRRGPPHADRGAHRVRQDAGGLPGLHRPVLPGPGSVLYARPVLRARARGLAGGGGYAGRVRAAGGVRVAAEGAGHRHPAEPGGAAAGDRRGGRAARAGRAGDQRRGPDR